MAHIEKMAARVLLLAALAVSSTHAFYMPAAAFALRGKTAQGGKFDGVVTEPRSRASAGLRCIMSASSNDESAALGRRNFLSASLFAAIGLGAAAISPASPAFAQDLQSTPLAPAPVAVFGANGETGLRVVDRLVSKGLPVRSILHRAVEGQAIQSSLRGVPVDSRFAAIEDELQVGAAVAGARAVICVVGLKPKYDIGTKADYKEDSLAEGTPAQVYAVGYRDLAKQCIKNNVQHLVILDSACTRQSETCDSMTQGEDALRDLYANAPPGVTYTIVRSGQLYNGEGRGPQEIEVNQGGDKSGIISRQDIAELLVEVAINGEGKESTFEAYYTDSAQPKDMMRSLKICEENGLSTAECFFGKGTKKSSLASLDGAFQAGGKGATVFPTGREKHSTGSWGTLITNLAKDQPQTIDVSVFGQGSG